MADPAPATWHSVRNIAVCSERNPFTISTERRSYRAGEQITLKYRVTNILNAFLYVPREWEVQCLGGPHVWAWFENSSGQHFVPGYGGSCSPSSNSQTVSASMRKEAAVLNPGEHLDGRLQMDTTLFGGWQPGACRIQAVLSGWVKEKFTGAERFRTSADARHLIAGRSPKLSSHHVNA